MLELILCEVTGLVIGYRTGNRTVMFTWEGGKRRVAK